MGLGGLKRTWQRQTKDFGHTEADKYTCLNFDNRGVGDSDKPLLRYTTSEMAKDVVELLDHVGWTEPRSVHVVGISMGGMISQELVSPKRYTWLHSSRILITCAGADNTRPHLQSEPDLYRTTHCSDTTLSREPSQSHQPHVAYPTRAADREGQSRLLLKRLASQAGRDRVCCTAIPNQRRSFRCWGDLKAHYSWPFHKARIHMPAICCWLPPQVRFATQEARRSRRPKPYIGLAWNPRYVRKI